MSLRLRVNTKSQSIRSAFGFSGGVNMSNQGDTLHYIGVNMDLLIKFLYSIGRYRFIPSRNLSIVEALSFKGQMWNDEILTISGIPYHTARGIGSSYEELYHGSISRGILIFTSILAGKSYTAPSSAGEHTCEHSTYSGELVARSSDIPLGVGTLNWLGTNLEVHTTNQALFHTVRVSRLDPLEVSLVPVYTPSGDNPFNFVDLLRFLEDRTSNAVWSWNGSLWSSTMSGLQFSQTDLSLDLSYTMDVTSSFPNSQHYHWVAEWHIPLLCNAALRQPIVGSNFTVLQGDRIRFTYTFTDAWPWTGAMYQEFYGKPSEMVTFPFALSTPFPTVEEEIAKTRFAFSEINERGPLKQFKEAVSSSWKDIVPSAMFSTVDAFKEAEGYLGINLLQNLQKIPGIVDSLPQVAEAVKVLGKLLKRDLSLSTFREILDLATSTTLQANFEWRPYVGIVDSYLPNIASTLQSLSNFSGTVTGYGSFRHKIYNDLGREEVTLLTRTKLVMDTSPSGLLSAVLGMDAYGLLPKASNIWDLIPFSFVANWFSGVGEALRRAEYTLLMAGIPAYFVHTYTITSPLTADELDSLETSSSGVEPAALRLYYRDVTLYSPVPRDSRFGFGIPSGFPPLGTFGSLLYQLFFS